MKTLVQLNRVLPLLLAALLQVMPFWRALVPARLPALLPASWAVVFRLGTGTVAALSSFHAVSGATTSIATPYTVNATVGTSYSRRLTTVGEAAGGWSASPNPIAPGLSLSSSGSITGNPSSAGTFSTTITAWEFSNLSGPNVSAVFTITVTNNVSTAPPAIVTPPGNLSVRQSSNMTFIVSATGATPLNYFWSFGNTPLQASTNSTLTLSNVQPSAAGTYTVVVSNSFGTATTNSTLTVLVPPYVIGGPTNQTVAAGAAANFSINVGGTLPIVYAWKFAGTNITGATSSSLQITNVQTASTGAYTVVVTSLYGSLTNSAVLSLLAAPTITASPVNTIAIAGATINLSAGVSGSSLSYQWLFNSNNLVTTAAPALTLTNVATNQSGYYALRVSNGAGSATTTNARVLIVPPPSPSNAPRLRLVPAAANSATVGFVTSPGYRTTLQSVDSLSLTNWQTLSNLPPAFDPVTVSLPTLESVPQRFYRLLISTN